MPDRIEVAHREGRRPRAVGYVRVSSEQQTEGWSLEAQREAIRMRCESMGWELVAIYADEGVSAYRKKAHRRPEFLKMMVAARADLFDILVVRSFSRLARHTVFTLTTLDEFEELGIRFVSLEEPADLGSAGGKLIATMFAVFAEQQSNASSVAIKGSVKAKRSKGLAWGPPPFGYQVCDADCLDDDKTYAHFHVVPDKAEYVREVFRMYAEGVVTMPDIAAWLNAEGCTTNAKQPDRPGVVREGNLWIRYSVRDMLKNPLYAGYIKDGTTKTGLRRGVHEPIVSEEVFDRVQARFDANRARSNNAGRKSNDPRLLTRLTYCHRCNRRYQTVRQGQGNSVYLKMVDHAMAPTCVCLGRSFVARHVEAEVDRLFSDFELRSDWWDFVTDLVENVDKEEVVKERSRVSELIRKQNVKFDNDTITEAEFVNNVNRLKEQLASLKIPAEDNVREAGEYLENFPMAWRSASIREKSEILRRILKTIYVDHTARRLHSIVPRPEFAGVVKAMVERSDIRLEEVPHPHPGSELMDPPLNIHQFTTALCVISRGAYDLVPLEQLSQRVKDHRQKWGLSRAGLADYLGIHVLTVTKVETNEVPSIWPDIHELLSAWLTEDPPLEPWDGVVMGRRIRERLLEMEMTQEDLAEHLDVHPSAIRRWMRDVTPRPKTHRRILEWLAEEPPISAIWPWGGAEMGRRIRVRLLELGMTNPDLAELFGVTPTRIQSWVSGYTPPAQMRRRILEWLEEEVPGPAIWPWDGDEMGRRIRVRLLELGMTNPDLAELLDVTPGSIRTWIYGGTPLAQMRRRILEWLEEEVPGSAIWPWDGDEMGRRIRVRLLELGMTQLELADLLDVTRGSIRTWICGGTPPAQMRRRILEWLEEEVPGSAIWPWDGVVMGRRIRERLIKLGMTRRDLADLFGVTIPSIKGWILGSTPAGPVRRRILQWLEELPDAAIWPWDSEAIGQRIRENRLQLQMTQADLAHHLDVHPTTIWGWETGCHTPSLLMRKRISAWLATEVAKGAGDQSASKSAGDQMGHEVRNADTRTYHAPLSLYLMSNGFSELDQLVQSLDQGARKPGRPKRKGPARRREIPLDSSIHPGQGCLDLPSVGYYVPSSCCISDLVGFSPNR